MRIHVRVKGRVQGIGYRYFVIQTALKFSLTGWVINCSNGDVESEVQGSENGIKDFLDQLESGHAWARIDSVHHDTMPEKSKESGFEIQY